MYIIYVDLLYNIFKKYVNSLGTYLYKEYEISINKNERCLFLTKFELIGTYAINSIRNEYDLDLNAFAYFFGMLDTIFFKLQMWFKYTVF